MNNPSSFASVRCLGSRAMSHGTEIRWCGEEGSLEREKKGGGGGGGARKPRCLFLGLESLGKLLFWPKSWTV